MLDYLNSGHLSVGWSGPGVQVPRDGINKVVSRNHPQGSFCASLYPGRTGIFVAWRPFIAGPLADGKKASDPGVKSLQSRSTKLKVARAIAGATNVGGGSATRLQGDSMLRNSITLYCALLPAKPVKDALLQLCLS